LLFKSQKTGFSGMSQIMWLRHFNGEATEIAECLLPLLITEPVSSGKCGKIISHECEWVFRYQFLAAGARG
jgi:hypothetical protein